MHEKLSSKITIFKTKHCRIYMFCRIILGGGSLNMIAPLTSEIYWSKIVLWIPFVLSLINFPSQSMSLPWTSNFTFLTTLQYIYFIQFNNCDMIYIYIYINITKTPLKASNSQTKLLFNSSLDSIACAQHAIVFFLYSDERHGRCFSFYFFLMFRHHVRWPD